jgi:hypothetical protein
MAGGTGGMTELPSNFDGCQEDIADHVQQLKLPGIMAVHVKTWPNEQTVQFPCVFVVLPPESEEIEDGQWEAPDVIYPVQVLLADRNSGNNDAMRKVYLGWRSAIARKLKALWQLPRVPDCYDVQVRYGIVLDTNRPEYEYVVSGLVARCYCREEIDILDL